MKRITAILTAAAISLAAMLAACADPSKAGAKSAGAVTDTQTETEARTEIGSDTEPLDLPPKQTETEADGGETKQPEAPPKESEQEDTAPVPERGVTLNTDLLGEYKMTYAELTAKHGKMTGVRGFACGPDIPYSFETGYGYYWFKTPEEDVKDIVKCTDPEYGFGFRYVPGKTETYLCRGIFQISPDKMFIGDYETLSIEEISKIEGIHYTGTGTDNGMLSSKAYDSTFTYDGWNNDRVIIFIFHDDKNMIDLTSECRFWIHPMDIDKEEGRSE